MFFVGVKEYEENNELTIHDQKPEIVNSLCKKLHKSIYDNGTPTARAVNSKLAAIKKQKQTEINHLLLISICNNCNNFVE